MTLTYDSGNNYSLVLKETGGTEHTVLGNTALEGSTYGYSDLAGLNLFMKQSIHTANNGTTGQTTDALVDFASIDLTTVAAVPEPSSVALLGLGGLALVLRRRR